MPLLPRPRLLVMLCAHSIPTAQMVPVGTMLLLLPAVVVVVREEEEVVGGWFEDELYPEGCGLSPFDDHHRPIPSPLLAAREWMR
jgi:hypothetical protein